MALVFLPGRGVDRDTMRATLRKVMREWKWADTWGWDYPMVAMTAARLNEPGIAVHPLLMDKPKNRCLPNGHNYQRPRLHCYLPRKRRIPRGCCHDGCPVKRLLSSVADPSRRFAPFTLKPISNIIAF